MGQISSKAIAYAVVDGKRAYVITCSAEPSKFDDFRDRFVEIARTFRIE